MSGGRRVNKKEVPDEGERYNGGGGGGGERAIVIDLNINT